MMNKYYIEQLVPIKELEWNIENKETFHWVQIIPKSFSTITMARVHVAGHCDNRHSYRITDGGRVFSA